LFATWLQPFIAAWGLWAVFFVVMFESAGVPLPGETALVTTSIYAGVTGDFAIGSVIAVAAIAAMIGDNVGFWVGRHYGLPLVRRYGRHVGLDERRLALGDYLFERHGAKIVFFGRFVAFLRIFAALLAGVHGFPWPRFLLFNAAGAIVWASVFGLGGYLFGDAITRVSGPIGVAGFVAFVLGLLVFWRFARHHEERYFARMEAEAGRVASPAEGSGEREPDV
jgi:membrane protein DedA with SNARE-associated domain